MSIEKTDNETFEDGSVAKRFNWASTSEDYKWLEAVQIDKSPDGSVDLSIVVLPGNPKIKERIMQSKRLMSGKLLDEGEEFAAEQKSDEFLLGNPDGGGTIILDMKEPNIRQIINVIGLPREIEKHLLKELDQMRTRT